MFRVLNGRYGSLINVDFNIELSKRCLLAQPPRKANDMFRNLLEALSGEEKNMEQVMQLLYYPYIGWRPEGNAAVWYIFARDERECLQVNLATIRRLFGCPGIWVAMSATYHLTRLHPVG